MARNRANISEGQSAWVGDLRFGPNQLLPEGTVEYQVKGWFYLDEEERWDREVKGIGYSFTVPVGTSRKDIQELAETLIGQAWFDEQSKIYPSLADQVSLFGDDNPLQF